MGNGKLSMNKRAINSSLWYEKGREQCPEREGLFGFGQTISHDYDRLSKVRKAWKGGSLAWGAIIFSGSLERILCYKHSSSDTRERSPY